MLQRNSYFTLLSVFYSSLFIYFFRSSLLIIIYIRQNTPFQVCSSMHFDEHIKSCNHHQNQDREYFLHPKQLAGALYSQSPPPLLCLSFFILQNNFLGALRHPQCQVLVHSLFAECLQIPGTAMWNGGFTKEKPCAFPQKALRWLVKAFLVALMKNVFQIASAKEFYLRLQHSSEPENTRLNSNRPQVNWAGKARNLDPIPIPYCLSNSQSEPSPFSSIFSLLWSLPAWLYLSFLIQVQYSYPSPNSFQPFNSYTAID